MAAHSNRRNIVPAKSHAHTPLKWSGLTDETITKVKVEHDGPNPGVADTHRQMEAKGVPPGLARRWK